MKLQPNVRTRITTEQAIAAFRNAHLRIFGIISSDVLIWVMTSWSSFETDAWRSMHDFNMVNMRGQWHGLATTFKAGEVIDGKEVFLPPSPDNLFRAYPSENEGAEDAMCFVGTASQPDVRPNRYARAWNAAVEGDFETFVDGLAHPTLPGIAKVPGFFTANPRVYLAGVLRHAEEVRPYLFRQSDTDPVPAPEEVA